MEQEDIKLTRKVELNIEKETKYRIKQKNKNKANNIE
jgi:hypothetical protein